jgi:murein DD-endopeptidase MepM/ murein hydrolase activator NlpD
MAIKQLDQDSIDSIYNRLVFTSKTDSITVDKKSVVSMSNTLTDSQNYFNILETSLINIKRLNDFKIKRDKQLAIEKTIEAIGSSSASGISGLSVDFSSTVRGFGLLTKQLDLLNEKLEDLDFSSGSCDSDSDTQSGTADDDDDDTKRKKKKKPRGRRSGSRPRLGRFGRFAGRALGVFGVGLDVADRVDEGQSATKVAVGVGGGLAGGAAGAAGGAALGALGGPLAPVTVPLGGLIGGALGYFGGSALADRGYEEISKTSYSSKFAEFLRGSISNVMALGPALAITGGAARIVGGYLLDQGGELPVDAGVLDAIAKAEGTYGANGYNTSLGYGQFLPGGKEQNLTNKSLQEILQLGDYMRKQKGNPNSSALGRYQIVGTTLKDAAKALKLDLNTTKFSPEVQDRLAMWILKKQGFGAWEGFKKNPELLQFANKALSSGRIKGAPGSSDGELTGGQLMNPLAGYSVSSEFGPRKRPRGSRGLGSGYHKGMDFDAPEGTPIAAAGSGKVVKVNPYDDNNLGLYIEIDHGGGLVTQYGHMSGIAVRNGMEIKAGQTIGYVGQTGNSTGPHLHFVVMRNGEKVNPRSFLTGKPENKFSPESNTPFKKLLKPKKKSKTKIVKVPEIVYVPVYDSTQGPRLRPQSPSPVSGKQTNFYLN